MTPTNVMNRSDMETQPMTADEAAHIAVILLDSGQGRISDDGRPPRPWIYVNVSTEDEAEQLYEAFGGRGFAKPRRDGYGGRYGAWGNDALEVYEYLLGAGLNGGRGKIARSLLAQYGNGGRPWASELERLRAGGP
jgi:hypothetical protein